MLDTSKVTVEGTKLKIKKMDSISVSGTTIIIKNNCLKEKQNGK